MRWLKPKTDWTANDRFNPVDYNRIKNNIWYLSRLARYLKYPVYTIDMGEDKTYESPGYYADEFNAFEDNLKNINNNTYNFKIGQSKTYYPNGPFLGYDDLNRIESACLLLYEPLEREKGIDWILPIRLLQNGKIGGMF